MRPRGRPGGATARPARGRRPVFLRPAGATPQADVHGHAMDRGVLGGHRPVGPLRSAPRSIARPLLRVQPGTDRLQVKVDRALLSARAGCPGPSDHLDVRRLSRFDGRRADSRVGSTAGLFAVGTDRSHGLPRISGLTIGPTTGLPPQAAVRLEVMIWPWAPCQGIECLDLYRAILEEAAGKWIR